MNAITATMQISEVHNKEEFSTIVINELKEFGVKYRKEKKAKVVEAKQCRKQIFRTHLHLLELADVILVNGSVVQVPKFVADSCQRILDNVETEGIFRKAGSSLRQKQIRINLEAGLPLGKSHHVIDVANVVKYFFRELPEPLIPPSMQETFLRSLLVPGEHHVAAVLLTCLLLPPLTINTLSFFMQFLYTVTRSEHANKMNAENLAIILTPGLMPFPNLTGSRFGNHLRLVQLLIENASYIGTIPTHIIEKLHIHEVAVPNTPSKVFDVMLDQQPPLAAKKKKKRRSEMFNGIRKIVGSAISSENLESTPESNKTTAASEDPYQPHPPYLAVSTPCIKSSKKRKVTEPVCAFSAKKKKDLLGLLPGSSGGFLPNTPLIKESKKSRMSLGGNRHSKVAAAAATASQPAAAPSMERRWSIVGSGWSRGKNKNIKKDYQSSEDIFGAASSTAGKVATEFPAVPPPPATTFVSSLHIPGDDVAAFHKPSAAADGGLSSGVTQAVDRGGPEHAPDESAEFVHVRKEEYEDIKERVAAIESRISREFGVFSDSYAESVALGRDKENCRLSGPESVLDKYERVVQHTETLAASPGTEQLAQRLSRGLKIRRSGEHRVIRSPSARKIGTMRRRSQERVRLSRNQTWHIGATSQRAAVTAASQPLAEIGEPQQSAAGDEADGPLGSFYARSNLKRGRPNTLHTGLLHSQQQYTPIAERPHEVDMAGEQWTAAEEFFGGSSVATPLVPKSLDFGGLAEPPHPHKPLFTEDEASVVEFTPVRPKGRAGAPVDVNHTPMLPPKSVPRRACLAKTPNSKLKAATPASRLTYEARSAGCATPGAADDGNGRESIARLRTQNAGMVMAKAKLFDGLGEGGAEGQTPVAPPPPQQARVALTCASERRKSLAPPATRMATPAERRGNATERSERRPERNSFNMESPHNGRRKAVVKSPASIIGKRYHLSVSSKYAGHRQCLDVLMRDEYLVRPAARPFAGDTPTTTTTTSAGHKSRPSPRTPKSRYPTTALMTGSPRYGHKTHRNSPRLTKPKTGRNFAV